MKTKGQLIDELRELQKKLFTAEQAGNRGLIECYSNQIRFIKRDLEREGAYEILATFGSLRRIASVSNF